MHDKEEPIDLMQHDLLQIKNKGIENVLVVEELSQVIPNEDHLFLDLIFLIVEVQAIIIDDSSYIVIPNLLKNEVQVALLKMFTFVIAFLLLLTGSALNDQHGEESVYFGNYYCYVVKPGVFAGGAVLAVASVVLGILYYLTLNTAKNTTDPSGNAPVPNPGGIATGQPQFPPQSSQDPVFVHEDTYNRRLFT
ncbi:hypothetical protein REPUB_Repub06bG0092800 [Reevesia pubescens]